ncbi:hypothetical protein BYT27DRAFT_7257910 [Phlegmacium glaucopus]|nr:hypothetical protein BYT27DRAFT_7257910 [Phlegmacium glaucopus]
MLLASATLLHEAFLFKRLRSRPGVMDNVQRRSLVYPQEVETGGNLGEQALVLDVEGTWRDLTGVVGKLAAKHLKQNLSRQSHWEDLNKQIEVRARDEILDPKNTLNGMMIRLRALVVGVVQVTLEVGSQGKLGGQVHVNRMCASLTDQVQSFAGVTTAVARGDLTQKIEISVQSEMSTLEGTVNSVVDQLSAFASEVTRVALEVGTQGTLGGQARVEGVQGTLANLTRNVNKMASNLTDQVSSTLMFEEVLDLKMTVNSMVARLSALANKITRVSLEVGTEGILGG